MLIPSFALALLSSATVSGATSLRLGANSFHELPNHVNECVKLESCWQDPVKLHNGLESIKCSTKFGIESSGKHGSDGMRLKLTVESIGSECESGDVLKAHVHGPEDFTVGVDLRLPEAVKLNKVEFVLPFPGLYAVDIFHHYIKGLGQADPNTDKMFGNRNMTCGIEISPTCAAYSNMGLFRAKPRSCDFTRDDPTKGFWQISDSKRVWHPWGGCTIPAVPSSEDLKQVHGVGQIAIIGTSRPRTFFYDMLRLMKYRFDDPKDKHGDMSVRSATGPDVNFMWGDCMNDLKPGPLYGTLESSDAYEKHFSSWVTEHKVCESKPSVVVFSIGMCEIDRSPFDTAERYVRNVLRRVAQTCRRPHRIIVASEMAVHQEYKGPLTENGMSNERIVLINGILQREAQRLGLEFLDLYNITSSYFPNDSREPLAHYFQKKKEHEKPSYLGNKASRQVAKILLASFQKI